MFNIQNLVRKNSYLCVEKLPFKEHRQLHIKIATILQDKYHITIKHVRVHDDTRFSTCVAFIYFHQQPYKVENLILSIYALLMSDHKLLIKIQNTDFPTQQKYYNSKLSLYPHADSVYITFDPKSNLKEYSKSTLHEFSHKQCTEICNHPTINQCVFKKTINQVNLNSIYDSNFVFSFEMLLVQIPFDNPATSSDQKSTILSSLTSINSVSNRVEVATCSTEDTNCPNELNSTNDELQSSRVNNVSTIIIDEKSPTTNVQEEVENTASLCTSNISVQNEIESNKSELKSHSESNNVRPSSSNLSLATTISDTGERFENPKSILYTTDDDSSLVYDLVINRPIARSNNSVDEWENHQIKKF